MQQSPDAKEPPLEPSSQLILTLEELAEYLRIPKSTLYKLAQEGKLPGQKVGRQWRFLREAVDRWLEQPRTDAGKLRNRKG